ncbi:MAG TPA: hypothetical protein VMR90_00990 [Candidatus Cybelea sp.]|nr:hypothetical protein [Candidatus Cybelea sp.]
MNVLALTVAKRTSTPRLIWRNADHYGRMLLDLRPNGIVPPASRPQPPELQSNPESRRLRS